MTSPNQSGNRVAETELLLPASLRDSDGYFADDVLSVFGRQSINSDSNTRYYYDRRYDSSRRDSSNDHSLEDSDLSSESSSCSSDSSADLDAEWEVMRGQIKTLVFGVMIPLLFRLIGRRFVMFGKVHKGVYSYT